MGAHRSHRRAKEDPDKLPSLGDTHTHRDRGKDRRPDRRPRAGARAWPSPRYAAPQGSPRQFIISGLVAAPIGPGAGPSPRRRRRRRTQLPRAGARARFVAE